MSPEKYREYAQRDRARPRAIRPRRRRRLGQAADRRRRRGGGAARRQRNSRVLRERPLPQGRGAVRGDQDAARRGSREDEGLTQSIPPDARVDGRAVDPHVVHEQRAVADRDLAAASDRGSPRSASPCPDQKLPARESTNTGVPPLGSRHPVEASAANSDDREQRAHHPALRRACGSPAETARGSGASWPKSWGHCHCSQPRGPVRLRDMPRRSPTSRRPAPRRAAERARERRAARGGS